MNKKKSTNQIHVDANKKLLQSNEFNQNPLAPMLIQKIPEWIDHQIKLVSSDIYNSFFDYTTGFFARCGKTIHDDPLFAEAGPEILDLEVSTICHGITGKGPCQFCYKANTGKGKNMSFDTFRTIFDKMPLNLSQIAFGIGDIDANPELFSMMNYCWANPQKHIVVPNITINGDRLTKEIIEKLTDLCGAVAVSHYDDDICFNAVKQLTDAGLKQVNIHQMISEETFNDAMRLIYKVKTDPRLKNLNAVVFLSLKTKGRGKSFHPLNQNRFNQLLNHALLYEVIIGFDSCSSLKVFDSVKDDTEKYNIFKKYIEPCESTIFSSYINVDGLFFPCSFAEESIDTWKYEDGLDVLHCHHFLRDIWYHPKTINFRNQLLLSAKQNNHNCRTCLIYKI